jgi:branched-chain amino acid transport system substrate-binding protein
MEESSSIDGKTLKFTLLPRNIRMVTYGYDHGQNYCFWGNFLAPAKHGGRVDPCVWEGEKKMKYAKTALAAVVTMVAAASYSPAKADITIATVGPMTGQYATFGEQMKAGAEMAVKDLNAAGGVLGQKVKLLVEDDACDPKQAVAIANKLASEKVVFVAGHFCSGSSIPASQVYTEEDILQISPASTNPKLTEEGGPNVYRTCGRDDQQGLVAGNYIADHFGDKKIAILQDKTAYGKGLADETMKQLEKRGIKPEMYLAYTAGEKDYSALVSKLKEAGIDVVYIGGYHTEAGLIIRQAYGQGYKPQLISGDALVTDEYWKITGPTGEGTLMTFSPDPRKNPDAAPVVKRFRDEGIEPEGYVLYTYGAIQAWAQAVEKAGTTKTEAVEKVLNTDKFNTVLGDIGFDSKGDVTAPGYVFYVWKDGKYDYVQ